MPDLRPRDELEEWKKKCPVAFMEQQLISMNIMNHDEIKALDTEIKSLVQDAVDFAMQSPEPAPEDAMADIFSE